MKKVVLMMLCVGSCAMAGDFVRPRQPVGGAMVMVPQARVWAMLAAHVVNNDPIVIENDQKKPLYQHKYSQQTTIVPKNQKFPKSNTHRRKNR